MRRSGHLVVLALLAGSAAAGAEEFRTELTPIGGYRFGGSFDVADSDASYEVDDAPIVGLIWNHTADSNTQYEVYYATQDTDATLKGSTLFDPEVGIETHVLEIGGTYLWDGDQVQPYMAATVGGTHIKTDSVGSDSDTFLSGAIGLGLKIWPSSRVGLRLEARAHGVLMQDSTDIFCQTGPDENSCNLEIEGKLFSQFEAFAGIVIRF